MNGRAKGGRKKPHGDKRLTNEILFAMEESLEALVASQLVIQKHLATINRKMSTLMTKADDLNAKQDETQAALDSMQARVDTHVADLKQMIQDLTDQINAPGDGITGAEADALLGKMQATLDDIATTDPS